MITRNNFNKTEKTQKEFMPDRYRFIFAILFLFLCLFLIISMIDSVVSKNILLFGKVETNAMIIKKNTMRGKSGYSYYIKYIFNYKEKEYQRTYMFGLFNKNTNINMQDYDIIEVGSEIPVVLSKILPYYNNPVSIGKDKNYFVWQLLGAIVFGIVFLNELKYYLRKRR